MRLGALNWLSPKHAPTKGWDGNLAKLNPGFLHGTSPMASWPLKWGATTPRNQVPRSRRTMTLGVWSFNEPLFGSRRNRAWEFCVDSTCKSKPISNWNQLSFSWVPFYTQVPKPFSNPPETHLLRPHSFLGCKGAGRAQFSFSTPTPQSWKEGRPECACADFEFLY